MQIRETMSRIGLYVDIELASQGRTAGSQPLRSNTRLLGRQKATKSLHKCKIDSTRVDTSSVVDPMAPEKNSLVDLKFQPFLDAWDKGFVNAPEVPEGYFVSIVEGSIPEEIEGTFFRNGPNRFCFSPDGVSPAGAPVPDTLDETCVQHPYDGDGFVASLSIKDGKAFYRARFVETSEYLAELDARKILFRGTFATQRAKGIRGNIGDLYVKNTANTNVEYFKGNLWALFEAGQPYKLDPYTLETVGVDTLSGAVKLGLPFDLGSSLANAMMGNMVKMAQRFGEPMFEQDILPEELTEPSGEAVTAHPKIDPELDRMVTFSYQIKPGYIDMRSVKDIPLYTELQLLEFEEKSDGVKLCSRVSHKMHGFAFLHDFALTQNYFVIFQNPVTVDNVPYILGKAPAASCVRWLAGRPTIDHIIPRAHAACSAVPRTFKIPSLFVFHHANAYEENCIITVDSIHYPSLPAVGREALPEQGVDPNSAFNSKLRRVQINMHTGHVGINTICDEYLEMPSVDSRYIGRKHRYIYGYKSDFPGCRIGVARVDTEQQHVSSWFPGEGCFLLEPRFIPRKSSSSSNDEANGWLLAQYFDSGDAASGFFLFDAQNLEAGPICKMMLNHPLPSALHGLWTHDYFGPL